jgi:hypothetical protein
MCHCWPTSGYDGLTDLSQFLYLWVMSMFCCCCCCVAAGALWPVEVSRQCDGQHEEGRSNSGAVGSQGRGSSSRSSQGQQQAGSGTLSVLLLLDR